MKEADFNNLRRIKIKERDSKVNIKEFGRPFEGDMGQFLSSLPSILSAKDLKEFIEQIIERKRSGGKLLLNSGAHPVKLGLNPIIIDLMAAGIIDGLSINSAFAIHDFEIAFFGRTSEDVAKYLRNGLFGMAEETGKKMNEFILKGYNKKTGLGESFTKEFTNGEYAEYSVLASAYKFGIPVFVHPCIGTDIINQHPEASGAAIGETGMRDFKRLVSFIGKMEKGIVLHMGSAVVVPEVFLKAVNLARNLYGDIDLISGVIDMNLQYRELENVVSRPVKKGYFFVCREEILFPLIASILKVRLK